VSDADELLGVNSRQDLALVEGLLRSRATRAAMTAGATLLRPETITLDDSVVLSEDVVLEPFVSIYGRTLVGSGSRIGQGCIVRDSEIGQSVVLKPYSVLESSRVGDGCVVGPFARLREGTELAEGVHIGNFVETKKARLARGAKANHLAYLGDTTIGERTNVGAGVITCNYDGFRKNPTTIGADVFLGSDSQLVAPVTVGDRAIVGAGTTVTKDVPADALVLARSPQENLDGYATTFREKRRKQRSGEGKGTG
jgi:bifunctional UDP-N-acetylglucosamine pyrophosphorylase/glucosamine-1-phosphate N-acetyltransferase